MDELLRADELFIFIGAQPHTAWLDGTLAPDGRGFILAGRDLRTGAAAPT